MSNKTTHRLIWSALLVLAPTFHSSPALGMDTSCRTDSDCVVVTQSLSPCRCAPCGGRAVNKKAWQRWKKKAPRLRCRKLPSSCARCRPIKPGSLKAVCLARKCQLRAVTRPAATRTAGRLSGNVKSRIYHGPSCHYYRCKNCTASFATSAAARKAGFRACKKCGGIVRAPVVKAPRNTKACKRNKDCGFMPAICPICNPCKPTWRDVGNLKAIRRARGLAAIVDCAVPRCRACARASNWRGTKVVCLKGRCTAR